MVRAWKNSYIVRSYSFERCFQLGEYVIVRNGRPYRKLRTVATSMPGGCTEIPGQPFQNLGPGQRLHARLFARLSFCFLCLLATPCPGAAAPFNPKPIDKLVEDALKVWQVPGVA